MRQTALLLNAIVVVFFLGFLGYTFFTRQHLTELARAFVTDKTVEHSRQLVRIAAETLESPVAQKLLNPDLIEKIRQEIAAYQSNPKEYVADLTRKPADEAPIDQAQPLLAKLAVIKRDIRAYYNGTLDVLIFDLRIFAISNLTAGAIAFSLIYRTKSKVRPTLVWYSLLMFAAVCYCTFLYIDSLTFFRILFRLQLGWTYPLLLGATIVVLYREYGHLGRSHDASSAIPIDREPSPAR